MASNLPKKAIRLCLIELFVPLKSTRRAESVAHAVWKTLMADPDARNYAALSAIETGRLLGASLILCPGWTFVSEGVPAGLHQKAGGTTVLFETVTPCGSASRGAPKSKSGTAEEGRMPWQSWIYEGGRARMVPGQVMTSSRELHPRKAALLCEDIRGERRLGSNLLLICGEINILYLGKAKRGAPRPITLHPVAKRAGICESMLRGPCVLNPTHVPNDSFSRRKQLEGPWRSLITTSNIFDKNRLPVALRPARHSLATARWIVDGEERALPRMQELEDGGRVYLTG